MQRIAIAILLSAVLVAGCASSEQVRKHHDMLRGNFERNIAVMSKRIKPEHMAQCRKLLEGPTSIFGGHAKILEEPRPGVRHTCAAYVKVAWYRKEDAIAAYVARVQKYNAAGKAFGNPVNRACAFEYDGKDVKVWLAPTSTPSSSFCPRI